MMYVTDQGERRIELSATTVFVLVVIPIMLGAAALRLMQLDHHGLSWDEAKQSMQSFRFYTGRASLPSDPASNTSPLVVLWQSLSFLLFGATDVTARLPMALAGLTTVALGFAMRPFLDSTRATGVALFLAVSPAMLYASRTVNAEILIGTFALLVVVLLLYLGQAQTSDTRKRLLAVSAGIALAAMFGSGPASISVIIALAFGCLAAWFGDASREGAVASTIRTMREDRSLLPVLLLSFAIATVVFFSLMLTEFSALAGIGESFADWARLIGGQTSNTPTQYFLLAIVLYQAVALLLSFYEAYRAVDYRPGELSWFFFLGWFVAALLLFSFSSGRTPEQAVLVTMPLVIWGGMGAGRLFEALFERAGSPGLRILLVLAFVGLIGALGIFASLLGDTSDIAEDTKPLVTLFGVILLAIVPLALALHALIRKMRTVDPEFRVWPAMLAAVVLILALFSWRASVQLSFFRSDEGTELLAQRTSTAAVSAFVTRIEKLSRDLTVNQGSALDPTGGHGLSIAVEESAQWPWRWYFRQFPNLDVVEDGAAAASGAQLVLLNDGAGIETSGYTARAYPFRNRVPSVYAQPDIGTVLKAVIDPRQWGESMDFILFRDIDVLPAPETMTAGYGPELSQRLFPSSGPYSLSDRPGPGSGRGQFEEPRDLVVAPDTAAVFVVDMGNGRVQHFDAAGEFAGAWGDEGDEVRFEVTEVGLGPTGIAIGDDGLVYVADTWNHRVKVLDQDGRLVREFGGNADNADATDPNVNPGLFFGPRDIVVLNGEIFVVDTGNERVQVFAPDGTFLRAFGGFGSESGELLEPVGIAAGLDGNIYVADSSNARISVFSSDGTPLMQFPVQSWLGQLYFEPYLAFDALGRLYASSSATGSIDVFDTGGAFLESIRFAGESQLQRPYGLALGPGGNIYVADAGIPGVLVLVPPGPLLESQPEVVDELVPATPGQDDETIPPTATAVG